jgi:hypothetical protein
MSGLTTEAGRVLGSQGLVAAYSGDSGREARFPRKGWGRRHQRWAAPDTSFLIYSSWPQRETLPKTDVIAGSQSGGTADEPTSVD